MEEFGDTAYVVIVARDISERLRAEEVLRNPNGRGSHSGSTENIVFHDRRRIVWVNRAAPSRFT
jgi:hypothetical protein